MAWDLGDTVPLTAEIVDADGALTAASGVVCTIGLPDGTTVTPAVSNPSTGRYTVDFVPTMPGRHTERWTSTTPATARVDIFDVRPAEPPYIFSLADAKNHLRKLASGTVDDEELRSVIEATTAAVEDLCGEVIVRREFVENRRVESTKVALTHVPVVSLTSIESLDGGESWDVDGWDVATTTGIITAKSRDAWPGCREVKVTYLAGYQVLPARYTEAAQIILKHQWSSQHAGGDGGRRSALSHANDDGFVTTPGGYAVPRAAAELVGGAMPGVA